MPDPATNKGDYCFECYDDMRCRYDEQCGKEWIAKRLPSMPEFVKLYAKHCRTTVKNAKLAGNCHAAATVLVTWFKAKKIPAFIKRGHWLGGDVRPELANQIAEQHSWVQVDVDLPNNSLIFYADPTQFVFTGKEPSIAISTEDDQRYDPGGYKLKEMAYGVRTMPDRKGKTSANKLTDAARSSLDCMAKRNWKVWTLDEVRFLANLNPDRLGSSVKDIYKAIEAAGHQAFIPIDARREILGC